MANKTNPAQPIRLGNVTDWDIEVDVAVIGFGGAGSCAAIEAHDAGAKVAVFELGSDHGGSTALSGGDIYMGGGTPVQTDNGFEDSKEAMFEFLKMSQGNIFDEAKVRAYVDGSVDHYHWLVDHDVPFKGTFLDGRVVEPMTDDTLIWSSNEKVWPFKQAAKPAPRGHTPQFDGMGAGGLIMERLGKQVHDRKIAVHYDARALTLVADDDNNVHGVVVRIDQQEKRVKARKGVILCAGGFIMNEEMVKKYTPHLADHTMPIGNPGDTGGGIQMGMGVGGSVINMGEGFISLPFYPPADLTFGMLVNAAGQRFINEDCYHGRVGHYCRQQAGDRIYLVSTMEHFEEYQKMNFLQADIVGTGETIAELETELELPEGSLQSTMEIYNRFAKDGKDPLFHKSEQWVTPIEPPYVALDCTPGRGAYYPAFTLGGLDTLPSGEVKSTAGNTIAGLYAAGRTACGIPRSAKGYGSGMSVGDATFSGRMAGKAAATRAV